MDKLINEVRVLLESAVPPASRRSDWNDRWNALASMDEPPLELRQLGASGGIYIEELKQAVANGHLTADEALIAAQAARNSRP